MRVKKHPTGNEYINAKGVWVRNFTKTGVAPLQLTHLYDREDYAVVLKNEEMNKNNPRISDEVLRFEKVVIVSDGYMFEEKHTIISSFPKDVCVLAVNRALSKWKLYSPDTIADNRRAINAFLINNPYREALTYIPGKDNKYFPACIASIRTSCEFTKKYPGDVYVYRPTQEEFFGHETVESYHIDDYRNPICAAIGIAYRFGVKKLMLFCCDDSFKEERESAVQLPNGFWTYPQHVKSGHIIDANLHWLTHQEETEVVVGDFSNNIEYVNASYIKSEEEAVAFFGDNKEGTLK